MENRSSPSFGENVRIRSTPETELLGIADRRGQIYGVTTPSFTGIAVIGTLQSDYAINVYFEDRKKSVWLAPELVEFLDRGAGAEITADDLPESPWKRFAVGFCVGALCVSFAFFLYDIFVYGDGLKDRLIEDGSAAVIVGLFVGTLSAFGKKILHFFITLFTELF